MPTMNSILGVRMESRNRGYHRSKPVLEGLMECEMVGASETPVGLAVDAAHPRCEDVRPICNENISSNR